VVSLAEKKSTRSSEVYLVLSDFQNIYFYKYEHALMRGGGWPGSEEVGWYPLPRKTRHAEWVRRVLRDSPNISFLKYEDRA
jgi:hypothetical protein